MMVAEAAAGEGCMLDSDEGGEEVAPSRLKCPHQQRGTRGGGGHADPSGDEATALSPLRGGEAEEEEEEDSSGEGQLQQRDQDRGSSRRSTRGRSTTPHVVVDCEGFSSAEEETPSGDAPDDGEDEEVEVDLFLQCKRLGANEDGGAATAATDTSPPPPRRPGLRQGSSLRKFKPLFIEIARPADTPPTPVGTVVESPGGPETRGESGEVAPREGCWARCCRGWASCLHAVTGRVLFSRLSHAPEEAATGERGRERLSRTVAAAAAVGDGDRRQRRPARLREEAVV